MFGGYEPQFSLPSRRIDFVGILGTGASNPTKEVGEGVTVTRVSTGLYRFTFAEHVGTYEGAFTQFAKNTVAAGDGKNITVDHNSYTASGRALDIYVEDSGTEAVAPALADLGTDERLYVWVQFKRTGV